jgi:hypothetical protein
LFAAYSSYKELDEDDSQERGYAKDEVRNLKDLWWAEDCIYNVDIYKKKNHMREREKKRKRDDIEFARVDGIARGETRASPLP